jgi:hypothetical protein
VLPPGVLATDTVFYIYTVSSGVYPTCSASIM